MDRDPLDRARALLDLDRAKEARSAALEALAAEPERVDALKILAACHLRTGDGDAAEKVARAAVRLDPTDDRAAYLVAWALWMRGKVDEARLWLREATRMDPNDADYHFLGADIHAHCEEWKAADEAVHRGLRIDPHSGWGLRVKVTALVQTRRHREALTAAEGALRRHPEDAELHRLRGEAARALGLRGEARESFETAVRQDPSNEVAARGLRSLSAGDDLTARAIGGLIRSREAGLPWVLVGAGIAGVSGSLAGSQLPAALPPSTVLAVLAGIAGMLVAAPVLGVVWAARSDRRESPRVERMASRDEGVGVLLAIVAWWIASGGVPVGWLAGFSALVAGQSAAGARLEPPGPARRQSWMISIGSLAIASVTLLLTVGFCLDSGWVGVGYIAVLVGRGWQIIRGSDLDA